METLKHPDTILIKNSFYPKGLSEFDIFSYYSKNKDKLLEEVKNRNLLFFIATNTNNFVVKRKLNEKFIKMNNENFDKLMHGRIVSVHSTMGQNESFGIIDVDCKNFNIAKETTIKVYNYIVDKISFIKSCKIRFTGKSSFHIVCSIGRNSNIDSIRMLLRRELNWSNVITGVTIGCRGGRSGDTVNLDLSPNKLNGAFITRHSLSVLGLCCTEIDYDNINSFKKEDAKI